jgi:uncharacterized delta-60 repeat protein
MWGKAFVGIVATVGVWLVSSAPGALARPVQPAPAAAGDPVRFWSVSKIEQGAGEVEVDHGAQVGGVLNKVDDLGPVAFNFRGTPLFDRAEGDLFSSADGKHYAVGVAAPLRNPHAANSAKGAVTHLDEYQAYEKRTGNASLRITISRLLLEAVDGNPDPDAVECSPTVVDCSPIRSIVRFHARAYAASAGGDFYNVGGVAFIKGHNGVWDHSVDTSADSQAPVWSNENVIFDPDRDDSNTFTDARTDLDRPPTLKVPLASVRTGELFAVHVTLEAEAVSDRGHESAAQAFVRDPQGGAPALLTTRGLTPRGKPSFKEPAIASLTAARCPAGTPRKAGTIQFSAPAFATSESSSDPLVLVTRTRGARGSASVTVSTHSGSAQSGRDFTRTSTTVRFGPGDTSPRLVEIPIREDQAVESPEDFTVSLSHARCAKLGAQRHAAVTILDDDAPPTPATGTSPAFKVGGTVDGLEGSGLLLVDQGEQLPVAANGSFTFPGTFLAGSPYDVRVAAQPANPDQVCSVVDGAGTVTANVSNVAVHCARVATPTGLDTSFGVGGRVSTPGGGDARAVVIRPDGGIIVVGRRDVGVNAHTQFGAAGYDAAGNLDPNFGTGGIATTPIGGTNDGAFDAADDRDGGFVAVGRTDAAGLINTDFAVARYTADGKPNPAFPAGGFVTTDVAGRGDGANAVAVQSDGKIVAAGFAQTSPIDFDFALARYNPDGTLDHSFGGDGIVTTDLGNENEAANAVAIQPDGKIVAVGDSGENVALARYLPGGGLDPTFGGAGTVVSDLGFDDVANGVAIASGGTILIAGTRLGPHVNLDPYVASYGPNGRLNVGFGDFGIADTDLSGGDDFGDDLVLDPQGDIVVVGSATSPTVTDMALVRYRPDGALDTSLTTDFHGFGDFGHDLAIDPQGRIVAAGTTGSSSGNEFALMRASL